MEQAAILYGDFDGNGNALVIRTAGLSNLLYTVGGYLIGFTVNGIDYFHFDKTDFGKGDIFINAGYFSLEDWLSYWADEKKLSEIRKFDYVNFTKVKKDDQIVIEKQKTSLDTANYNWNEVYKYIWNVDEYRLPFSKDIYMPSNAVKTEKAYTEVNTATNFFQNAKILINLVESENQSNLMKTLVYSAYCIHHICASILPLFTEASHQQLIAEQKAYWSNPFPDTSGLSEFELINLTKDFYTEVLNFYVTGFRQKVRIQNAVGDKKFYHLTLLMSVKSLTTLTSKIKIKVLKSATNGTWLLFSDRLKLEY
ncbi:hypothetical protein [Chryseobacterium koreense]|uniref:hypothetical protein n=1 Tax=Chryseobacterium koreense TaxID=232216 RepID=UPI00161C43DF|nr:hypothetical protein [Chryseobacterium koreense]MBB5332897.1 hypothetical protein [Chryseobacterium koreense]